MMRKVISPANMAKTPATITEAEADVFEEMTIWIVYIISGRGTVAVEKLTRTEKWGLTFAFFSPKLPVEKFCEWRRAHAADKEAKRSSGLPRRVRNQARLCAEL